MCQCAGSRAATCSASFSAASCTANPSLIVANYPARGLDVASAAQIRNALVARARDGAAVLISSEELDESLEIANRVLVMHRGEIVAERDPARVDMDELGRLITTGAA